MPAMTVRRSKFYEEQRMKQEKESKVNPLRKEFDLNTDPMSIVRSLPTIEVSINDIKGRSDFEHDQIFLGKYVKYLTGKLRANVTRIQLSDIEPGFYKPTHSGLEYICDSFQEEAIEYTISLIRSGHRPALHLYESINKETDISYVCPDDVPVYFAYKKLGIKSVPSHLLCSARKSEESSIAFRGFKSANGSYTHLVDRIFPNAKDILPSILGSEKPDYESCFTELLRAVSLTKESLAKFHNYHPTGLHYHHTLYSILVRCEESLQSMLLLFNKNLHISAAMLVRSLYELALTFYLDWLAPTEMYRYLQFSSVLSEKELLKILTEIKNEDIKKGLSHSDAQKLYDAKAFAFRLTSVVSEKARLFPCGEQHHKDVYKFLSKISHHDFSVTQRYINTLEHGSDAIFTEDVISTTLYCADLFTTAIVIRIIDDVGEAERLVNFTRNGERSWRRFNNDTEQRNEAET